MEEFFSGLFELVFVIFGDIFGEWMRRLAAANRAAYIAVFCVVLLALLGGAAFCAANGWWMPVVGLLAVSVFALLLFAMGLRKPRNAQKRRAKRR